MKVFWIPQLGIEASKSFIFADNCSICSFIRLADYLIVNTMHVLAANSVATLLNYLEEQLQHTPTPAQIQGTSEEEEAEEEKPEGEGVEQKVLFVIIYGVQ